MKQRYIKLIFFLSLIICLRVSATDVPLAQVPVESTEAVSPNILMILDDSGSMRSNVVWLVSRNGNTTQMINSPQVNALAYNPEILYQPWLGRSAATPRDGTYYNWQDSNRNDRADSGDTYTAVNIQSSGANYSGGANRTDCAVSDNNPLNCTAAQERQNYANWNTFYRTRANTAKSAFGLAIASATNARIGLAGLNSSSGTNVPLREMNLSPTEGNKNTLLSRLYNFRISGGTPLPRTLQRAGRHFECVSGDIFGSSSASSPGDTACGVESATDGGACQQNYAIMISDGAWFGSVSVGNSDGNNNTIFDGGAFADTRSNTLADVAMHYYERDLHSTLSNNVPTTASDRNGAPSLGETMHQHMKSYMVAFGLTGTIDAPPTNRNNAFPWTNPFNGGAAKIDDMLHAAYNGRGEFLTASDPSALANAISDIFRSISISTGGASAVSFNASSLSADSVVYRASYDLANGIGGLVAQRIDEEGVLGTELWNAASGLDSLSPGSRIIITYDGDNGVPFRAGNLRAGSTLTEAQINYLRGDRSNEGSLFRERLSTGGLLGDIVHSSPQYVGGPSETGRDSDPYPTGSRYSTFASTNNSRTPLLVVGSNDGMLHAFRASTGSELFAYIPSWLITNPADDNKLNRLTDLDYDHEYFVDLTPTVADVYIDSDGGSSPSWTTVVIGGMRAGGRGFFALDITNPGLFNSEATAGNQVLWEFDHRDDANLGYSFSPPLVVMSNLRRGGEQVWVAAFGNGFNSASETAQLFVNEIEGGIDGSWSINNDYHRIDTGEGPGSDGFSNGLGAITAFDQDNNGTVDYIYGGDLKGNLYRFDVSSRNASNWSFTRIFTASYPGSNAGGDPENIPQAIVNAPLAVQQTSEGVGGAVVVVGTGTWFRDSDRTDTSVQSIYGIWDDLSDNWSVERSNLLARELVNRPSSIPGIDVVRTINKPSPNNCGSSAADDFCIDWSDSNKGWYMDLTNSAGEYQGERAIRNFISRAQFAFVNTVIPDNSGSCGVSLSGFQMAFNPLTGGDLDVPIFDFNNDGKFDSDDNTSDDQVIIGNLLDGLPSDASFIGTKRAINVDGKTKIWNTNTLVGDRLRPGRQSWREISVN